MIKINVRSWLRRKRVWKAHVSRETIKQRILRLLGLFILLIVTHATAMIAFEDLSLRQALWLTVISVTTIGYGDYSATTPAGQLVTVILICFLGIWLLAQLTGEWVDYRIQRRERMLRGEWNWSDMNRHLVIVNLPNRDSTTFLLRLMQQVRQTPELNKLDVVVVTDRFPEGMPVALQALGVVHINSTAEKRGVLDEAGVKTAAYVLVLANESQSLISDSVTLDILDRIRSEGPNARVVAESVQDENRDRFLAMGAMAVMRPVRAYPELIVRALAAPGTERILENLFTYRGDSTYRYDINIGNLSWKKIVLPILEQDLGTPLGYMDDAGVVHTNPSGNSLVSCRAIFILVRDKAVPSLDKVKRCLV